MSATPALEHGGGQPGYNVRKEKRLVLSPFILAATLKYCPSAMVPCLAVS